MSKDENGHGSDGKFKPEFIEQAAKLARLGATDFEIAGFFKVHVSTLHQWKHDHEGFVESLRLGKEEADNRVERALYQRAVGYSYDSVKIFQYEGCPVEVPFVEHIAPDVQAGQYWLNNRKGYDWKSKVEHEHSGTLNIEALNEASERAAKG